jgi:hypothetical protein
VGDHSNPQARVGLAFVREWNDDDYDVLTDDVVVGRIMKASAAPEGTPWLWTLAYGQRFSR